MNEGSNFENTVTNFGKMQKGRSMYTSFMQIVHLSDFGNIRFLLNACLLSKLLQTGEVQTKA